MRKYGVVLSLFAASALGQQQVPSPVSVIPSSGFGLSQIFTFFFSDPDGWLDLGVQNVLIQKDFLDGRDACYLAYNRPYGRLYLVNNAGTDYVGYIVPGSGGSVSNNQCTIYGTGSSASGGGTTLTLVVNMSFTSSFAGNRIVWLAARDAAEHNSGWQALGVWNIPGEPPASPAVVFLNPQRGIGQGPTSFTSFFSDSDGWQDLGVQNILINSALDGRWACYIAYSRPQGLIYLVNDEGDGYAGWLAPGSGGTVSNSKCTIYGTGSSASGSGAILTLTLRISFASALPTNRIVWLAARDMAEHNSGWQSLGTWTVPAQQYTTLATLNQCITSAPPGGICALGPGTYPVTSTISVNRSNVTVTGGSAVRTDTKLVRDPSFTGALIQINAPSFAAPGITLQNFTVCGGLDRIRDIDTQTDVSLGTSPVGCPRQQTTPAFTSRSCGDMLRRITRSTEPDFPPAQAWNPSTAYNLYDLATYQNETYTCIQANINRQPDINPAYWTKDFPCTDVEVQRADTGEYQANPFPSTSHYSLTIANVDLEDAAGHALSLFEAGTPGSHINDIYIHGSAVIGSAVTGILYGNNITTYHTRLCDTNPSWLNDPTVFAPRNLRIEYNQFANNHTGAMGGGPVRWVGLRSNGFANNYIHPQVGNVEGGTVEFDPCADKFEITGNGFYAPSVFAYNTDGLELYSRNFLIQGNTISGYPLEGIALNSVFGATVTGNVITNNATIWDRTGGIAVSTAESMTGPCGDPRESRDVTISNNTVTGQLYGVYLKGHDLHSTATLRRFANPFAVALSGSDWTDSVGQDGIVVLDSYSLPTPSVNPEDYFFPRALAVQAVAPVNSRCSTGTQAQTFALPASHADGGSHIRLIEGIFSISGRDEDGKYGPDNGAGGCHFAYFPQLSPPMVYLDGPLWEGRWTAGSSVVGPGGIDLNNGYCMIHAGWTPAPMPEPYISPFISHGRLVIEFAPSSFKKHIYTVIQDDQLPEGRVSDGGTWKYWGWWATQ